MSVEELVLLLKQKNIRIFLKDGELKLSAPKGAVDDSLKKILTDNKQKLMSYFQNQDENKKNRMILEKSPCMEESSLSSVQQGIWFQLQLDPDNYAYNIPIAFEMNGNINVNVLEEAFRLLIERHATLRTSIVTIEGAPRQKINNNALFNIDYCVLENMSSIDNYNLFLKHSAVEARKIFDLKNAPLLRVNLYQANTTQHYMLLVIHHIISDGWSMSVLLKDLSYYYNFLLGQDNGKLPELKYNYVDYCYSEERFFESEFFNAKLDFWNKTLSNSVELLNMPADKMKESTENYKGFVEKFSFEGKIVLDINSFIRKYDTTLFTLMLSVYYVTLHKYCGQDTILVGTNTANRLDLDLELMVGCFVNTLVLKMNFCQDQSFISLLKETQQNTLLAYRHQEVPFDKIVETVSPDRSLLYSPLIQTMCILQNVGEMELSLFSIDTRTVNIDLQGIKHDISLSLKEIGSEIVYCIEYNPNIFNTSTIERFAMHFKTILLRVIENPELKISEISMLDNNEWKTLIESWNNTAYFFDKSLNVYTLFEEQVAKNPSATALFFDFKTISYMELDAKANKLANHLVEQGVKANMIIGVYFPRSIDLIVSILAIGKAGGAYLPLDPAYPSERLSYMLTDSNAQFVIGTTELLDELPITQASYIDLDGDASRLISYSSKSPKVVLAPDSLAYVMYTSGTTGKPKGVLVTQLNLINHMLWMKRTFDLNQSDRILQRTSVSFDPSIWEVFLPLIIGATSYIANNSAIENASELITMLDEHKITVAQFIPELLNALLDIKKMRGCTNLRFIFCGGGCLTKKTKEKCLKILPTRLYNLYGPTETTIDSSYFDTSNNEIGEIVPIGKPIDNTKFYVLDRNLQPAPINVPGELYVSGYGVSMGYCGQEKLISKNFIPNPFDNTLYYNKMYKTGDIVRWLESGNIEYLGRQDEQVKIRGYRIELKEIENKLFSYKHIKHGVVTFEQKETENKQIIAYVILKEEVNIAEKDILQYLGKFFPCYMLPSSIVIIDKIPLLPNGKVDKVALQKLREITAHTTKGHIAPSTNYEVAIAKAWSDILGIERIGVNDNFFSLGGDSILIIQIIEKLNQSSIKITPKEMIQNQTIAKQAMIARAMCNLDTDMTMLKGGFPLTPIQKRFFEYHGTLAHWNQAIILNLHKPISSYIIKEAIKLLVLQHDSLRMIFYNEMEHVDQMYSDNFESFIFESMEIAIKDTGDHQECKSKIIEKNQKQFNLFNGPLFAVVHFKQIGAPEQLLLAAHHLVVDGISWRILVRDLEAILNQALDGHEKIVLPQKSTSYKTWANALAEHAQSPLINKELSFWLQQTNNADGSVPRDLEGDNIVSSLTTVKRHFSREHTYILFHDVLNRYRCQVNNILLTVVGMALSKWSGNADLFIDVDGHGREEIIDDLNLTRTIGWFTSIYPLKLEIDPTSFEKSLSSINRNVPLIPNHGVNYGVLRYLSDDFIIKKQLFTQRTAEICFNYLGQFEQGTKSNTLLSYAEESPGFLMAEDANREYLLDITVYALRGCMTIEISYSHNIHKKETIEKLISSIEHYLQQLIFSNEKTETIYE